MRQNKVEKRMALTWTRDDSKLSEMDLEVLAAVHFPTVLKSGEVAQKRISKQKYLKGWSHKQNLTFQDVVFVKVPRRVAEYQLAMYGEIQQIAQDLQDGKINLNKISQLERNKVESASETMAPKARQDYYIDGHNIQEEMEMILSMFSQPKPTPSMKYPKKAEKTEEKAKEKAEDDIKGLPNKLKGKAKEMYLDQKMSAKDIATELDVDIKRVIPYLKTLDK